MSLSVMVECEVSFSFDYQTLAERVVEAALAFAGFPYEAQVTLTLTDNEGIHALNQRYRGIDRPTDVLSFPMLSYETPGDFTFLKEEREEDFDPDTGEAVLGDIVLSVEKTLEQAESYGHTPEREYAFLIVHSMLHLFGYDHMEEADAHLMEEKQKEILTNLNILR